MIDPDAYRPDAQVFTGSKAKWLDLLDTTAAYEEFQQKPSNLP